MFLLGNAVLGVRSEDPAFRNRFREIYRDCLTTQVQPATPVVECVLRSADALCLAEFNDPGPLDEIAFIRGLFPRMAYREIACPDVGWRLLVDGLEGGDPAMAVSDGRLLIRRDHPWQSVVALLAVARTMRRQRDVVFLHAASLCMNGEGVLLCGAKGAGKTTLSTTLAARGQGFLGDEIAALQISDVALLALPRAASFRSGPRAPVVEERLRQGRYALESLADGTTRTRVAVSDLFPGVQARRATLRHAFFLEGFRAEPEAHSLELSGATLRRLAPFLASLWDRSPGRRAIELLRALASARCYVLYPGGTPEQTADLIEAVVRGKAH